MRIPEIQCTITVVKADGKCVDINPDTFFEWYLIDIETGKIRYKNPLQPLIAVVSAKFKKVLDSENTGASDE